MAFLHAVLWGLFPVLTVLSYSNVTPLFSLGLSTCCAAVFFGIWMEIRGLWWQIAVRSAWRDVFLGSLFIGVGYYVLFFLGLRWTSPGNGSIFGLLEVFFSFVVLGFSKRERATGRHLAGATLMALGAAIVLSPGTSGIRAGDLLVVLATVFPPIGNYFQQRARRQLDAVPIMFMRSVLSCGLILLCALPLEPLPTPDAIRSSVTLLVINGVLSLGLVKVFWIESIHRIPITHAVSLSTIDPAFTLLFAYALLGASPTAAQLAGLVPMAAGVLLIADAKTSPALA